MFIQLVPNCPQLENIQEKQPADQWTTSSTTAHIEKLLVPRYHQQGTWCKHAAGHTSFAQRACRILATLARTLEGKKTYLQVLRNPGATLDLQLLLEVNETELKHHKATLQSVLADTFPRRSGTSVWERLANLLIIDSHTGLIGDRLHWAW